MLPCLTAEESLRRVTEIAVGTASVKKEESSRIMRQWQRDADRKKERHVLSLRRDKGVIEAMGIKVEIRERKDG